MTALTEMLASCQAEGYSYVICLEDIPNAGLLNANGFVKTVEYPNCRMVDMRRPMVMIYDNYAYIREPFSDDAVLQKRSGIAGSGFRRLCGIYIRET